MIPNHCCVLLCLAGWALGTPAFGADKPKKEFIDAEPGQFSRGHLNPPELQFSDAGLIDGDEEALAKLLRRGNPDEKLAAARALWKGRSRRQATNVLKFLAGPPPGGEAYRTFQREVEAALQPQTILRELEKGDYLWGTWLAFLRPHKDFVPALLKKLKEKKEELPETMLALGNSGNPRALKPLLELMKSKEYATAGFAAQALGYFGGAELEPQLIEALASDNNWLRVKTCRALAKLGSRKAIPALEKLAKSNEYTGGLAVRGVMYQRNVWVSSSIFFALRNPGARHLGAGRRSRRAR
jgi:hypothetical protein